jgi:hypothetical protein
MLVHHGGDSSDFDQQPFMGASLSERGGEKVYHMHQMKAVAMQAG